MERGPDKLVSGFGYAVAVYNGSGAGKTPQYEGNGQLDFLPGELALPDTVVSQSNVMLEAAMTDMTSFNTQDIAASVAQAARIDAEDVIIESAFYGMHGVV